MSTGDNWTKEETREYIHKRAEDALRELKKDRKGKKFKLVKMSDKPLTYKEVEVKDDEK